MTWWGNIFALTGHTTFKLGRLPFKPLFPLQTKIKGQTPELGEKIIRAMKFKWDQFEISTWPISILFTFQLKYYYSYFLVKQKTGKKH